MEEYILSMKNITKRFGNVLALEHVSLDVREGEVHALVGENGAGKSTLMKILNGVYSVDEGDVFIQGEKVVLNSRKSAIEHGLGLVFQELNLVSSLTAVENAFLGRLECNKFGKVQWKYLKDKFNEFMRSIEFNINSNVPVSELSIAEKQMVEIARVLMLNSKILILDEPTATLTSEEIHKLFKIIKKLKGQGVTIIFISHHLEEIFEICDRITVLRDGKSICTMEVEETNRKDLIEKMVGRSMDAEFPERKHKPGEEILEIRHLFTKGFLNDINFSLKKGEILGLAGIVGSGRSEVARAIFGADRVERGEIIIDGRKVRIMSTLDAKNNSIGLIPEDRKEEGLALDFSILHNTTITNLKRVRKGIVINKKQEEAFVNKLIKDLNIKTPSLKQSAGNLSGGNQQKVVLAKWLFNDSDILIMDEPTRGIDVGAKYEIYLLMNALVAQGKSIIMISSELPEIFAMSDRICVMREGKLQTCVENYDGLKPEDIMDFAIG